MSRTVKDVRWGLNWSCQAVEFPKVVYLTGEYLGNRICPSHTQDLSPIWWSGMISRNDETAPTGPVLAKAAGDVGHTFFSLLTT